MIFLIDSSFGVVVVIVVVPMQNAVIMNVYKVDSSSTAVFNKKWSIRYLEALW